MAKRRIDEERASPSKAGCSPEPKASTATPAPSKKSKRYTSKESPSSVTKGVSSLTIKRKPEESYNQPKHKAPYGSSRRTNDGSPPSTPPPVPPKSPSSDGSTRSASSFSSDVRKLVISKRNTERRNALYLEAMMSLNKKMHDFIENISKQEAPCDAHFVRVTVQYREVAARIREKYLKTYGDVAAFGEGDSGQLGCGQAVSSARVPRVLNSLRGMGIRAVAAGGLHTLALTTDGHVYSWGNNDDGAVGGDIVDEGYQPCKVDGFVPSAFSRNGHGRLVSFEARKQRMGESVIVKIVAGETTSFALSEEGDVYMWGSYRDSEGRKFRHLPPVDDDRIGAGRKDMNTLEEYERKDDFHPPRGNQDWPMHITLPRSAKDISAGDGWAAVILDDESLLTWGIGTHGEMARNVPTLDKTTPNGVIVQEFLTPKPPVWSGGMGTRKVTGIACGAYHFLVLAMGEDGISVYGSGLNQYGQLGLKNYEVVGGTEDEKRAAKCRFQLTKIEYFKGRDIAKVGAGYHFSCFVNGTGKKLYACGRGDYGQLGNTLEQPKEGWFQCVPSRVPLVYTIDSSEVKDPKTNCINESKIVEEDQPEIEQISCGSTHVLVVTKDGDVYSWGFGESGACGHGKCDKDVLRPKKLVITGGKHRIKFVSGGGQHSAAVVVTKSRDSQVKK